jgi:hypothetical protein
MSEIEEMKKMTTAEQIEKGLKAGREVIREGWGDGRKARLTAASFILFLGLSFSTLLHLSISVLSPA